MSLESSLLLTSTIFILGIMPGPGIILVISSAISGGILASFWTIAGILTADLVFLLVVVYGLQAIATALDSAIIFIQIIGAIYLIWLGVSIWKIKRININTGEMTQEQPQPFYVLWFTGLLITLSNPKAIIFYVSFLPTIINIEQLILTDIVIMALIICTTIGGIMFFYALTALKINAKANVSKNNNITQKIAGSLIITTGLFLLARRFF